jgi:Cdc6-like AAA superfamily ATPase
MSFDIRTAVTELFMIQQIKTGNLLADAILFGFFIFMLYQGTIVTKFKSMYNKFEVIKKQSIKKNWCYLINKFKKKSIVYKGYMYSSGYRTVRTYVDYPPPMIHVLDYMQKHVYKVENTYNIKYCEVVDVETNTVVKTFIPADEMVSFELYSDIYIELSSDKNIVNKEKNNDFLDFSTILFYIKTYEHDISYIHSFIKMCEEKFEYSINEQLSKNKYIFKYNSKKSMNGYEERQYDNGGDDVGTRNTGIKCDEYPLVTNKHLIRNCFFTQRDALIKRINFFIHNEQWYNDRGIPYQLTLVFEGPPGCGKTSTVKGIATYTNRHIVDVDLNGIKDVCELENIFNGTHINGKYIPSNKRIFMIDEIDKFFELLDDREQKEKMRLATAKESTNSSIVIVKEGSNGGGSGANGSTENRFGSNLASTAATISGCANKTMMNELTKGQILSIMDGIIEAKGRFIICTANDTSKIDPMFKRPGRMDEFIHFTKCDAVMIYELMDLFYDGTVNEERVRSKEELERFKPAEFQLSPSELNKICFNNILSREEAEKRVLEGLK